MTTLAFTSHNSHTTALNRRESLLHYLQRPLAAPVPLDTTSSADRHEHDQQRMDYLSGGIVLATSTVAKGKLLLARAFQENRARNSGHSGVMLSGDSSLGKTTTAKRLLRWVLEEYTRQVPHWEQDEHIPAAYVEVPSGSNAKDLLREFCDFYGLSVLSRDTTADLRTKVVGAIRRARTQLIVVDELHNLAGRASGLGEAVDLLKGLHNDVSATFLYCGLDVTNSTLMHGARGQQLMSRFAVIELKSYDWADTDQRKEWKLLIRTFESQLQLRDHTVRTLDPLAEYLYQRTGGSIGSLSRLLTGTAIDLIQNKAKVELLDQKLLDAYTLDLTAETFYRKVLAMKKTKSMSALEKVMA
ncbi:ATP-binding protein [Microbacterium sp. USTB-Y]|uniref:ATP-binding protein n=1 Tax=Microbacterium sp. USTB-Y TaxID=2823692 RepID=UPI00203B3B42|nr:ATP-binding protein [Microbacterium sp. USTB-Y]